MPELFIITGSNGAGKSSIGPEYLPVTKPPGIFPASYCAGIYIVPACLRPINIADNFYGNLEKLNEHYEIFQTVQIIDTSEAEHLVLAVLERQTCECSTSGNASFMVSEASALHHPKNPGGRAEVV